MNISVNFQKKKKILMFTQETMAWYYVFMIDSGQCLKKNFF